MAYLWLCLLLADQQPEPGGSSALQSQAPALAPVALCLGHPALPLWFVALGWRSQILRSKSRGSRKRGLWARAAGCVLPPPPPPPPVARVGQRRARDSRGGTPDSSRFGRAGADEQFDGLERRLGRQRPGPLQKIVIGPS